MFKGLRNLASLVKSAEAIHGRIAELQEKLGQVRVEGSAGGGMVTVEADGQQKVLGIRIESSLWESGDRELLEDLLVAAVNQAIDKSREAGAQELSNLASGLELSGLNDVWCRLVPGDRPTEPA